MKYIRLGNEIYKIIKEKEGYFELRDALDVKMKCYTFMPKREQDYKIANTIEELCDEFVWNVKGSNKRTVANNIFPFSRIKIDLDKQFHGDYEIYGAIWTEKGLIYVAKMNEKGKLELL